MQDQEQTTEVRTTETTDGATNVQRQTVATKQSADGGLIAQRIIWYIAGFIIALLVLRLVLLMLAANQGNAFVDLIYGLSAFFAWPFFGIFGYQPTYGQFTFEVSTVVAILVYALVAWGLAKAFTLTGGREA